MSRYGNIGKETADWYSAKLLRRVLHHFVLDRFGRADPGLNPKQCKDCSYITDVVQDTPEDEILIKMAERHGEQIGETFEESTYDILKTGDNVYYGNKGANARSGVTDGKLTPNLHQEIVERLKCQKAEKFDKLLLKGWEDYDASSEDYGMSEIEPCYIAVCHSDLKPDIRELEGFVQFLKYGDSKKAMNKEFGTVGEVRYVCVDAIGPYKGEGGAKANGYRSTGSKSDVYPILYLGKDAYGCIPLRGEQAIRPFVCNPGIPRDDDPYGERGWVAWEAPFACEILNDAWMVRAEVACSQPDE